MIVKKHINNNRLILAAIDESISKKLFCDGEIVLDLTSFFYSGERFLILILGNAAI